MQQPSDPSHTELEPELSDISKERKRWERKRLRLQHQLAHTPPLTGTAVAQSTPPAGDPSSVISSSNTPPSDVSADVAAQPPYKRRVVLRGGVQEAITKLQGKSQDEEKSSAGAVEAPSTHTSTTAALPLLSPTPPSVTSSVDRVRSRRMFAGLLSHLSAASTTLTRDRTTLAQQQRMQQPPSPAPNTTQQLADALSRCQQVEAALHRKHIEYRRRRAHSVYQQCEQWKADWLWTADDGEQQPTIAWRVREMTQVWQVVREEEAKQRTQRRRKARMERGEEDEEVVEARKRREGWSEEDESELQRLIQQDRDSRQDAFPTLVPDSGGHVGGRPQQQPQQASFYKPPGRRQHQPPPTHRSERSSANWQHSDISSLHTVGPHNARSDRQVGGNKRRRDSLSDDDERDGRRSRAGHRRPMVDEFGRDVHDDDDDWPAATQAETAEDRTAREKAERLRDEETERLLNVD